MECSEKDENGVTTHFLREDMEWKPFLRQALIASGPWTTYFTLGLLMGSPTVIIPQMRREANSTEAVSDEMASWLSSTFCYSAIPWVIILPKLAQTFGRKRTIIFISFTSVITYLTFYFSSSPLHLLITEILIGIHHASSTTTCIFILTEYVQPKYRGIFLSIKSASLFWGIWIANIIGTYTHWTYIPKFGLVCSLYTLSVFFWPESPFWLAGCKRFVEAKEAHRLLKGISKKSECELEEMIKSYAKYESVPLTNLKFVKSKEFYMPLFLSMVAVAQYHFSGKFVITIYALDIMKKIMTNESDAYKSMLILDGITVLSAYTGCILIRYFKRRYILLTATGIAITFLSILTVYLYLIKLSLIIENMYLSIFFLGGFSIAISSGPMIMMSTLYGELIPVRFKNICISITAIFFFSLHGTILKLAPFLFRVLSMPGMFLFYAITSFICAVLMYLYLPETKDKTLLEIEDYFKDVKDDNKKLVVRLIN